MANDITMIPDDWDLEKTDFLSSQEISDRRKRQFYMACPLNFVPILPSKNFSPSALPDTERAAQCSESPPTTASQGKRDDPSTGERNLRACALVSHAGTPRAQKNLFATIDCRNLQQSNRLFTLISQCPTIAAYITTLEWGLTATALKVSGAEEFGDLSALLQGLPALQRVELSVFPGEQLETLELHSRTFPSVLLFSLCEVITIMSAGGHLETLALPTCNVLSSEPASLPCELKSVGLLTLFGCSFTSKILQLMTATAITVLRVDAAWNRRQHLVVFRHNGLQLAIQTVEISVDSGEESYIPVLEGLLVFPTVQLDITTTAEEDAIQILGHSLEHSLSSVVEPSDSRLHLNIHSSSSNN
ncbi:hypothetical protein B0H16DRAFT_1481340 [Mycena metata]|uniref:Uncharacterized protein n=1 Tax=Mycena metata TaxID=1033252 RepID=A0AAD7GZ49_9AGAR|nr:hypothetical protein B0H16DRAFT_1481340 [Mycena metata]